MPPSHLHHHCHRSDKHSLCTALTGWHVHLWAPFLKMQPRCQTLPDAGRSHPYNPHTEEAVVSWCSLQNLIHRDSGSYQRSLSPVSSDISARHPPWHVLQNRWLCCGHPWSGTSPGSRIYRTRRASHRCWPNRILLRCHPHILFSEDTGKDHRCTDRNSRDRISAWSHLTVPVFGNRKARAHLSPHAAACKNTLLLLY